MQKSLPWVKRALIGLPLVTILGASLFPIPPIMRQELVLFTLLWFHIFILLEVFAVK